MTEKGLAMSDDNWVLIGTALDQLKQNSTLDIDGYLNVEHALLSKLREGLIPARAASLVKKRTFKGHFRGKDALHDVEIEPDFWIPEFAVETSGQRNNENPSLTYSWDWARSTFLRGREVTDKELGLKATQLEEAVGVRIDAIAFGSCFGIGPLISNYVAGIKEQPHPGGRRPKYQWEDAMAHLVALAIDGQIETDPTASEIAERLMIWCRENEGEEPSASTAHQHANKVIIAWNQLKILEQSR